MFHEFSLFILFIVINWQAGEFFKLIAYVQLLLLNNIADTLNGSTSPSFSLRLHQHPNSILWRCEHRMRRRACLNVQTSRSLRCSMM